MITKFEESWDLARYQATIVRVKRDPHTNRLTPTPNPITLLAAEGVAKTTPSARGGGAGRGRLAQPQPRREVPYGSCRVIREAPLLDARSLRICCPKHPMTLALVTDIQVRRTNELSKQYRIVLEVLCFYCGAYQYVRMLPVSVAELPPLPGHE